MKKQQANNAPIGIFDSGFGGLTVARAIKERLPHESLLYFGDSARCPYGPRPQEEVRGFVREICSKFVEKDVKLIVIACNTATAAGLKMAQREFAVPIIGVVEPGARAAVRTTRNRKVGVIATQGTVQSGAYEKAMHSIDAGVHVVQQAAPRFVELVEERLAGHYDEDALQIALDEYLKHPSLADIDTLVLGCTHFPLIEEHIQQVAGKNVTLISSATETARDVDHILRYRGHYCDADAASYCEFITSSTDKGAFKHICSQIMGEYSL